MIPFTKGTEWTIFGQIKISGEVLQKIKSKNFKASKLSTYDFSALYTTLPHNLIIDIHEFNFRIQLLKFTISTSRIHDSNFTNSA